MSQVSVSEFGSVDDVQRSGMLGAILAVPLVIFISTCGDFKECVLAAEMVAGGLAGLWSFNKAADFFRKRAGDY